LKISLKQNDGKREKTEHSLKLKITTLDIEEGLPVNSGNDSKKVLKRNLITLIELISVKEEVRRTKNDYNDERYRHDERM
jgi:hypothetical protein